MILFESIRYKNFLSSGNYFTEIELNKDKSTLVVGHNGAGKSTVLDALSFALFGKPHRKITKNQLVNSINQKQCVVEVKFSIGQSKFKINRFRLKPAAAAAAGTAAAAAAVDLAAAAYLAAAAAATAAVAATAAATTTPAAIEVVFK